MTTKVDPRIERVNSPSQCGANQISRPGKDNTQLLSITSLTKYAAYAFM